MPFERARCTFSPFWLGRTQASGCPSSHKTYLRASFKNQWRLRPSGSKPPIRLTWRSHKPRAHPKSRLRLWYPDVSLRNLPVAVFVAAPRQLAHASHKPKLSPGSYSAPWSNRGAQAANPRYPGVWHKWLAVLRVASRRRTRGRPPLGISRVPGSDNSRPVGARDNRLRTCSFVWLRYRPTQRSDDLSLERASLRCFAPKVCDMRRPRSRGADGIHINLRLGSQEGGRRMATDSESETFELVYTSEAFPHGDSGFNHHSRVGNKPRSEGRLFTRTDQAGAPQIPMLHVRQCPIRICGAPLRAVHFTPGVHPDRAGDRGGAPETRCHDFHVPRRLAGCGPISIFRGGLARPSEDRVSNLRQCVALFLLAVAASAWAWFRLLGLMASMVDLINFCRLRMRPIQLHLLSFYQPHRHRISHLVPTTPWLVPHLQWWLAEANLTQGRAFRPPSTDGDHHHRCVTLQLGGDLAPTSGGGPVGFRTSLSPYKHSGNASGVQRTPAFSVRHPGESGPGAMRQRYGGSVHQSPRGHSVGSPLCAGVGSHPLVYMPWGYTVSSPHPRRGERNCRCSLQGLDRPYGVVTAPANGSFALPPDRPAAHGLVCLSGKQPTTERPDPSAWQIDALAFQWDGLLAYAFPPFSLIPRVLAKIESSS